MNVANFGKRFPIYFEILFLKSGPGITMSYCNEEIILKKHLINLPEGLYVDLSLFDYLAEETINDKQRKVKPAITCLLNGTNVQFTDVFISATRNETGRRAKYNAVVFKIALWLVFKGFTGLSWTDRRRRFVAHFFGPEFIPDGKPVENNSEISKFLRKLENREPPIAKNSDLHEPAFCTSSNHFWSDVLNQMNNRDLEIGSLIQHLKNKAYIATEKKLVQRPNYLKQIMKALFPSRYTHQFMEHLYLIKKTGNVVDLVGYLKTLFDLQGIRNDQLVPSVTTLNKLSNPLHCFYYNIFQPEKTYSGFRADLITLVRTSHYLLTGIESLEGVAVDLWGDGVEIGNSECTRMVFRFLDTKGKISPQSSDACFTFACFKGLCKSD